MDANGTSTSSALSFRSSAADDPNPVSAWSRGPSVAYPGDRLIHELFEAQAERTPDAIALVYEQRLLTYAEFNRRANQVAHHLKNAGMDVGRLIGLSVERSLEMMIGLMGILKMGGAYVPLDPSNPTERLSWLLQDAAPQSLLIHEHTREKFARADTTIVMLDTDWEKISAESISTLHLDRSARFSDDLAYLIYTSGSTGMPKGVMVEHRNVLNLWKGLEYAYGERGAHQRIALNASLSFDASVQQIVPLLSGRTVYLVPDSSRRDASMMVDFIHDKQIAAIDCTPSQLRLWIAAGLLKRSRCPLEVVLVGGEAIDPALWTTMAQYRDITFYNVYGPTECTVDATLAVVNGGDALPHIGRPMLNRYIYILDESGHHAAAGAPGEIFIGGDGVARGYLNRPSLTAERFIADPWSTAPHARLYRTGDIGQWRANGDLEYLGRNDSQVKIRGFRVEPGEVETAMKGCVGVKDAVVIAQESSAGEKRLIGYVVANLAQLKASVREAERDVSNALVSGWQDVYDKTYSAAPERPSFVGWNSSYSGEPIEEEQMREWLLCTVDRIRSLNPVKVLEVGCGVGLILERLAPDCKVYDGVDLSREAIRRLRHWIATEPGLRHVRLQQCSALEIPEAADDYDTVILNSVVQYFPDVEYFIEVLRRAARQITSRGQIFVGDVRHAGLLNAFHTSVELYKADSEMSVGELRRHIARGIERDEELVIDPQFFAELPEMLLDVTGVQISLKRGEADNELTRYRYDVILDVRGRHAPSVPHSCGVHNPALARDLAAMRVIAQCDESQTVATVRELLNNRDIAGEDLVMFWKLRDVPTNEPYTSDPWGKRLENALIPRLRCHLEEFLPHHMVPSVLVTLQSLPLNTSGKVDRHALSAPVSEDFGSRTYDAPQGETEHALARIWQEVLQLQRVGRQDNFFELGADSMSVMGLVARVTERFSVQFQTLAVLRNPIFSTMAEFIERLLSEEQPSSAPNPMSLQDRGI